MKHKECRNLFIDALYGELPSDRKTAFDSHINECRDCAGAFAALQATADFMSQRKRAMPSADRWAELWKGVFGQIGQAPHEEKIPWWTGIFAPLRFRPVFAYSAAAAAFVLLGILLGRTYFSGSGFDSERLSQQMSATEKLILNERALNYLEKSKVLLLGIVNAGVATPSSLEITKQQEISRELVREAGPLKGELTDADQQRMRKLVGDLELILIQIANLEAKKDFPGLVMVKSGVDRRGILLKINLEQMRLQESERQRKQTNEPSSQVSS